MRHILLALLIALLTISIPAGEYNDILSIGDTAPPWSYLPGVDDQRHSWQDVQDSKVVVVVFTCNSCPYAVDIEDRLNTFQETYSTRGVSLVAINVNKVEADQMPAMKEKAQSQKFGFLYLYDESQQIAKDFGAKYTPEFFVLDRERHVVYMGAMDDSPDGKNVTKHYLADAVESVLGGSSVAVQETVPIGCRVRYERERRTRRKK